MDRELIENWLSKFNRFLEKDNKDLIGLFNQRILFTPDENNHIKPGLMELQEPYATKEQAARMNTVFDVYVAANPF